MVLIMTVCALKDGPGNGYCGTKIYRAGELGVGAGNSFGGGGPRVEVTINVPFMKTLESDSRKVQGSEIWLAISAALISKDEWKSMQ